MLSKQSNDLKNIIKNKKSSILIEGIYPSGLKGYFVLANIIALQHSILPCICRRFERMNLKVTV